MTVLEFILSAIVWVVVVILSLGVLSFIIMIPFRIFFNYRTVRDRSTRELYYNKLRGYARNNEDVDLNDILFRHWADNDAIEQIYIEMYQKYDPQYREEAIDDLLTEAES